MKNLNSKIIKEIAKIWAEVRLGYEEKYVTGKIGKEKVVWFVLPKFNKFDEWIFAKHYIQDFGIKPKEIARDLFFGSLKDGLKDAYRLRELKESFWARLKFLFINLKNE